ncbi:MAG: hypothetical protein Ct9H90mP5_09200 [Acidimicrobiaceae bacterium]|nr:MAG: hypothetical protein Ct9H90mP5_09200 [Acidimicrobiaceae bacterium]
MPSVQHTAAQLARDLEILETDLDYVAAGINHMSFFLKLEKVADPGKKFTCILNYGNGLRVRSQVEEFQKLSPYPMLCAMRYFDAPDSSSRNQVNISQSMFHGS